MMLKFTFGISKEEAYSRQGTYFLFEKYRKLKTKLEEINLFEGIRHSR